MQAIIIEKTGGASMLKIKDIELPKKFNKDDVLIRHTAIGVNFFDVCFRRGQYKTDRDPIILGTEACGIIEAVGSNVKDFKVGDRVAYATGPIGAYAQKRIIDKHHLVLVPQNITDVVAAGSLLKGFAAHSLLFRVYLAKRAKRILVHSAAGGVGQFLCQWARAMGVEVIGVVGSQEKVAHALENGCRYVINAQKGDFLQEVMKITQNEGVGVVYDGVGKDSLVKSLQCLWPMGLCVSHGESSGSTPDLNLNYLVENSLYLTRPILALYKANRIELALAAGEIFDLIARGILRPKITEYNFKDVAQAHSDLESRKTSGSLVLKL